MAGRDDTSEWSLSLDCFGVLSYNLVLSAGKIDVLGLSTAVVLSRGGREAWYSDSDRGGSMGEQVNVTELLHSWKNGDSGALERLVPVVQSELQRLARAYIRRQHPGHVLQPTALINEVYLRLISAPRVDWRDRAHFFALCAQIMRQILVAHARAERAAKRGGNTSIVSLDDTILPGQQPHEEVLAINEALTSLATADARKSRVVELRFFGGLSVEETAEVLGVSVETVFRDWRLAKLWLLREITGRTNV